MTSWENSYHRSTAFKPTVIHLKEKKNHPKYKPLPLYRLVDPSIYKVFPIPFMRVEIPPNSVAKNYKPKPKEHVAFDMEASNVAGFYLAHIDIDYEGFIEKSLVDMQGCW